MKFEVIRENPHTPPVTEIVITLTREEAIAATPKPKGAWIYVPGAFEAIEKALRS